MQYIYWCKLVTNLAVVYESHIEENVHNLVLINRTSGVLEHKW